MSLPVSRLVRGTINLAPTAAARRSFGILLIAGDSNVINGLERIRTYASIDEVADDFGTSAPEYLGAALYFGQLPKPSTLMIGRWLRVATHGLNVGGILTPSQQSISNWTAITNGGFHITIDSVAKTVSNVDFSLVTNLNGVCDAINGVLTGGTISWNGSNFVVTSSTTGTSSTVGYATAGTTTDISGMLKLTTSTSQSLVPGYAAETPVACAQALAEKSPQWYGLTFCASVQPTDDQTVDVAAFIEATELSRAFGVTTQDTNVLSAVVTTDIASRLHNAGYNQSMVQYSSSSPYAVCSLMGRAFSVNFDQNSSTITLMYKQEPGVTGEELTTSQANVLQDKHCNVFVDYVNNTKIIQYGVMCGTAYIDEIHGLDWLQDAIQNACYNLMYTSTTKIPQTDAGANQFTTAISKVCDSAGSPNGNGLLGPGTWTSTFEIGELHTGDFMPTGYYIFAQPMALQSDADRAARKAPPITICVKLAGAIQEIDFAIQVNR